MPIAASVSVLARAIGSMVDSVFLLGAFSRHDALFFGHHRLGIVALQTAIPTFYP